MGKNVTIYDYEVLSWLKPSGNGLLLSSVKAPSTSYDVLPGPRNSFDVLNLPRATRHLRIQQSWLTLMTSDTSQRRLGLRSA